MSDGEVSEETLDGWALRYRSLATFGGLALLLGTGKLAGFYWEKLPFLRNATVPPAVLSGILGCVVYRSSKGILTAGVTTTIDESLTETVVMMINFTFAALTLGFASAGTYVPRTRAVIASIWHEALPMLVYSQVLIWGQSCVALLAVGLLRLGNPGVSPFLGGLVTMGLETGRDVASFSLNEIVGEWADEVVRLADSVGLLVSIVGAVCLMTVHLVGGRRTTGARGYALLTLTGDGSGGNSRMRDEDQDEDDDRHREHFHRGRKRQAGSLVDAVLKPGREPRREITHSRSLSPYSAKRGLTSRSLDPAAPEALVSGRDKGPTLAIHRAGLGAHLLLPAVSVGTAWLIDLFIRFLENSVDWTAKHHIISGFRLFKLSMCAALLFMCIIRRTSPFRYNSEWFFRLSGLSLDLMATAAISSIGFASIPDKFNAAFVLVLLACLAWNVLVFVVLAPRMFPNFWFMRAMALIGDALGHSWVGLLVLRAMDTHLQTPVPLAYAYKMMMFFVPASGGKNAIVIAMVDVMGVWEAFLVCVVVCGAWLLVFDKHFKPRMPHTQQRREDDKKKKESSPGRPWPRQKPKEEAELVNIRSLDHDSACKEQQILRDPRLDDPTKILSAARLRKLAEALPIGQAIRTWKLAYSMSRDGASLRTLLQNCVRRGPCLIVVEDSWGYVFGGYVAAAMQDSQDYYGTGESFVFSFHPAFSVHRWTGINEYFCISHESWLAMGGGGGGFAFQIDDELDAGESNPSETFGSPRLSSNEFFKCHKVEVWTFMDGATNV